MSKTQINKQLSPVYELSDQYIEQLAQSDPGLATALGIAGHDHEMTDFSPRGHEQRHEITRSTLNKLNTLDTTADRDRLAAGVLRNSLEMSTLEFDAGEHLRSIRVIAGDVDSARGIFDLMPTATAENWKTIAERMSAVPNAFAGMRESWSLGIERKTVAPRRQALVVAEQLETWAGTPSAPGFFTQFAESASAVSGAPLEMLRRAAIDASNSMAETAGQGSAASIRRGSRRSSMTPRHSKRPRRLRSPERRGLGTGWRRRVDRRGLMPGNSSADLYASPSSLVHLTCPRDTFSVIRGTSRHCQHCVVKRSSD